jgi:mycothiol synthase
VELRTRPFESAADLIHLVDLIHASPAASRHRVDYPWRLSSPAIETGRDVRLWSLPDGMLVGFAAWYLWWATLDFYIRPGPWQKVVEEAIFAWAPLRFHELDAERGRPLPYWIEAREDDAARLALLARHGYMLDGEYDYTMLGCAIVEPVIAMPPPAGFSIRPIAGENEVREYAALHRRVFASASMTAAWRRTLAMPTYEPGLDIVAVAPNGQLVGFCVGWLDARAREGQIEPLGIDPDFQRLGLGHALITAMLARFREHGAERALVETETNRMPAREAYAAAGFRAQNRSVRKGQWFGPNV